MGSSEFGWSKGGGEVPDGASRNSVKDYIRLLSPISASAHRIQDRCSMFVFYHSHHHHTGREFSKAESDLLRMRSTFNFKVSHLCGPLLRERTWKRPCNVFTWPYFSNLAKGKYFYHNNLKLLSFQFKFLFIILSFISDSFGMSVGIFGNCQWESWVGDTSNLDLLRYVNMVCKHFCV